jgi:hypothetical protein
MIRDPQQGSSSLQPHCIIAGVVNVGAILQQWSQPRLSARVLYVGSAARLRRQRSALLGDIEPTYQSAAERSDHTSHALRQTAARFCVRLSQRAWQLKNQC